MALADVFVAKMLNKRHQLNLHQFPQLQLLQSLALLRQQLRFHLYVEPR